MSKYNVMCVSIILSFVFVFFFSCSKTTILNKAISIQGRKESKESRTFTPRDTTDTTRHEITFGPTVIGWELVDVEALPQEVVE